MNFVSDYIETHRKGHIYYDFVDVCLDKDNELFIDPCLLERGTDEWCKNATRTMHIYFDTMFMLFRKPGADLTELFSHAGEQNATKLGYGNGRNGKGKTAKGLEESLTGLVVLSRGVPTISKAQDLPVLVEGFAEDCLSDLLTNILHAQLNEFTAQQMTLWGAPPQGECEFWTFDAESKSWKSVYRPCWRYKGKELLLVPKRIIRKNYLFSAHQYLCSVIIERIQKVNGWEDLRKKDILDNLPKRTFNWEYNNAVEYTKEQPELLSEYHKRLPQIYNKPYGQMSDIDLDVEVYGESYSQQV